MAKPKAEPKAEPNGELAESHAEIYRLTGALQDANDTIAVMQDEIRGLEDNGAPAPAPAPDAPGGAKKGDRVILRTRGSREGTVSKVDGDAVTVDLVGTAMDAGVIVSALTVRQLDCVVCRPRKKSKAS